MVKKWSRKLLQQRRSPCARNTITKRAMIALTMDSARERLIGEPQFKQAGRVR